MSIPDGLLRILTYMYGIKLKQGASVLGNPRAMELSKKEDRWPKFVRRIEPPESFVFSNTATWRGLIGQIKLLLVHFVKLIKCAMHVDSIIPWPFKTFGFVCGRQRTRENFLL